MYPCSDCPSTVRTMPIATTTPTEVATRSLRVQLLTRPSLMVCACEATAISAGSATTAEKPSEKPNTISSTSEPFLANWFERFLPMGKMPSSSPCRNTATPTATIISPTTMDSRPWGTSWMTANWKNPTTRTMGRRLRKECNSRCPKAVSRFNGQSLRMSCWIDPKAWYCLSLYAKHPVSVGISPASPLAGKPRVIRCCNNLDP